MPRGIGFSPLPRLGNLPSSLEYVSRSARVQNDVSKLSSSCVYYGRLGPRTTRLPSTTQKRRRMNARISTEDPPCPPPPAMELKKQHNHKTVPLTGQCRNAIATSSSFSSFARRPLTKTEQRNDFCKSSPLVTRSSTTAR